MPNDLGFGSDVSYLGVGWGVTVPVGTPKPADPKRPYVGSGPGFMVPRLLHTLPGTADDAARLFGPRLWAAMLTDPAVSSSYNSLRLGAVGTGRVKLTAPEAFKAPPRPRSKVAPPKPGKPPEKAPADGAQSGAGDLTPEQARAQEVLEFCERLFGRLGENLLPLLIGLCDAAVHGVKLAELTYTPAKEGLDAGKLVWGSIQVKPNWAWRFAVDQTMSVQGIYTWDIAKCQFVFIKPEKFVWHSWMPVDNDPRGTSILRAAYNAWNLKIQSWPAYYQFLLRFGSPGIHGALAEGDQEYRQPLDANGVEIAGVEPVDAATRFQQMLTFYRSGGIVVTPNGATVAPFEPRSNGEALLAAFDLFDRQICTAIQLQARASMEAKHGSKADGETAKDTKDLATGFLRVSVAAVLRRALRLAVALNFGEEDAELYTPVPSMGESESEDRAKVWGAVASLYSAKAVGDSQKEELAAMVGLPIPDVEADRQAAKDDASFAADLAAKTAPPPVPGAGDTGKTGGRKPPEKGEPARGGGKAE